MTESLPLINTTLVCLNLILVTTGIVYGVRQYRFNRTWSYIERYNSSDFRRARIEYKKFTNEIQKLKDPVSREDFVRCLINSDSETDIERLTDLTTYINLFTELGIAHRAGVLSETAVEAISGLVLSSWDTLEELIREMRNKESRQIHIAFEEVRDYILKKELHLIKRHRSKKVLGFKIKNTNQEKYD